MLKFAKLVYLCVYKRVVGQLKYITMKAKKISLSFILLLIISTSCTVKGQYTKWEKNVKYHNIEFKKVRFIIKDTDTTYIEGYLSRKTIIDGYPCHKYVVFTKGWRLSQFLLADDYFMLGAEFPKETEVRFNKNGIHCFLGKDTKIQGYCCNGNYAKWYSMGISTSFYLSGKLKSFYPCDNIEIDNIPCKSSPFAGVKLFETGNLKECKLSVDTKIKGKEYNKNTNLIFDEEGNVVSAK